MSDFVSMEFSQTSVTLSIALGFLVVLMILPLAVVFRRCRPWITLGSIIIWISVRLSPLDPPKTILQMLEDFLAEAHELMVQKLLGENEKDGGITFQMAQMIWTLTEDLMAIVMFVGMSRILYQLTHYSLQEWKDILIDGVYEWSIRNVGLANSHLEKETSKFAAEFESSFGKDPNRSLTLEIPEKGRSKDEVVKELEPMASRENVSWQSGKVSGTVYTNLKEHDVLMTTVYGLYSWSNPLHAGLWPKLNQCEGEVISMAGNMLSLKDAAGVVTSGGTESIILAIRAHLNVYGKARGIRHPELVCGSTAHAAVLKACDMFGIRLVEVDCSRFPYQLQADQVRKAITANTIMIYGSAPCYPQGTLDPIAELSRVAEEFDVGLHVDACLGGFVLAFLDNMPPFDFRCQGVTSMSVDTHKYGYATKGTSVLLCRSKELRHGHYFSFSKWSGGLYATPTIAGSRPGALIACAWASLVATGQEGYRRHAQTIADACKSIAEGVSMIRGVKVITVPPLSVVVCIASDELDIYQILDCMSQAGWALNSLQNPTCIHICVTLNVAPKVDTFLRDLKLSVEQVRQIDSSSKKKGTAGVYGAVGSLPPGPVDHTLRLYTDVSLAP